MKLKQAIVDASEKRGARITRPRAVVPPGLTPPSAANSGRVPRGRTSGRSTPPIGANIRGQDRARHLEFGGARPSATELERIIGDTNDLVDEFYLERALLAARPVCRLMLRDGQQRELGFATGFLIAPRLALTNWHVFPTAADAQHALAEFNYKFDVRGEPVQSTNFGVRPDLCYLSDRALDFAIVALEPVATDGTKLDAFGYHRLVADPAKIHTGEWITIIQHPGGRRRQFAIRENQLIEKDNPDFLWYASDTAQGSSGAPAFNDSFQIVALHHSGKARRDGSKYVLLDGRRVTSLDGIDDADVAWEANEGLRVSSLCRFLDESFPKGAFRDEYLEAARGGDVLTLGLAGRLEAGAVTLAPASTSTLTIVNAQIQQLVVGSGAVRSHGLDRPRGAGPAPAVLGFDGETFYERMIEPVVDNDYASRKGYDSKLLGIQVPMPKVTKPSIVSRLDGGGFVLPYQHFSVIMHKTRRLALFTASNVTAVRPLNEPEPGRGYTRRDLGGFGEHDTERWLTDPRIPEQHQLPDVFYTKDRKAFDKGHIVRRQDVCWGLKYADVQRANGDTYHTTNCSPQVKGFNRAGSSGVWGRLENYILTQAKSEVYAIFAGPVFDDDDEWFEGVDKRGVVRIQIPREYWKVVVARGENGLESFAFLMKQDLSDVIFEEEFGVTAAWSEHVVPIQDLQSRLDGIQFPSAVRRADQSARLPF